MEHDPHHVPDPPDQRRAVPQGPTQAARRVVVLDWIPTRPTFHPPWWSRKQIIHKHLGEGFNVELPSILSCTHTWTQAEAAVAWEKMQAINQRLGCEVYEGVVAKRADAPYEIQLRPPDEKDTNLIKHRWSY